MLYWYSNLSKNVFKIVVLKKVNKFYRICNITDFFNNQIFKFIENLFYFYPYDFNFHCENNFIKKFGTATNAMMEVEASS